MADAALSDARFLTFGKAGGRGTDPAELKITLAHEMFHTFSPFIEQPAGLESFWFGEGLAALYMRKPPFRFGLLSADEFLDDLNFHAGRYHTRIRAGEPDSEAPKRFWEDTRIRTPPYDRGILYFADLDEKIRKRSAGKRSLDNLVMAMLDKEKGGKTLTNNDWIALFGLNPVRPPSRTSTRFSREKSRCRRPAPLAPVFAGQPSRCAATNWGLTRAF